VAIDGSVNAALLVVEMLAISDTDLQAKLLEDRARRAKG
jgi:phosphoribosylcarboxyaminoimidazole (NCAIR) mutase